MRKLKMSILSVALAMLLVGFNAPPVSATSVGVVAFHGTASTTSLGMPLFHAQDGTWSFSSSLLCQEATVNAGKKSNPQAGDCSIDGSGTFTGIVDEYTSLGNTVGAACGHSVGKGAGLITDSSGQNIDWTISPHWIWVGNVLLIPGAASKSATGQSGDFIAAVHTLPDPNSSGSCLDKTLTDYIVSGVAATVLS